MEGYWYFQCISCRGHYRTTAHAYRITITNDTSIASLDVKIETSFLSLASFTSINNGDLDPDFLIGTYFLFFIFVVKSINNGDLDPYFWFFIVCFSDVFGQVVDIGDMLTIQVSGEERKKCEFYLKDTRYILNKNVYYENFKMLWPGFINV